jgi:hypothetical protein
MRGKYESGSLKMLTDPISLGKLFTDRASMRIGKIGLKQEPAGKVRIFAMVDPFTQ